MSIEVRPAERRDIESVRSIATQAWRKAHAPIVGMDAVETFLETHYDAESFRERLDRRDAVFAVAVDDDTTGYAFAARNDETTFDLVQIYVAPDRWGEGVGRRLLDHVEQTVADRGAERMTLGVMAENDRAVGFYEAAGYDRVDKVYDDRLDTTAAIYAKPL